MPEVVFTSEDHARGVWAMMDCLQCKNAFSPREAPDHYGLCGYGHYEEEYVRSDDGWKISFPRLTRLRIDPLPLNTPLN